LYDYDQLNPSLHKWGRTVVSMLIEWDSQNTLHRISEHKRVAHTDFNNKHEGVSYIGFIKIAVREFFGK